jgi:hypothetical protein
MSGTLRIFVVVHLGSPEAVKAALRGLIGASRHLRDVG